MSVLRAGFVALMGMGLAAGALGQNGRPGPSSNLEGAAGSMTSAGERGGPFPPTDNCSNASPITGLGLFGFSLAGATTDGLAHPQCEFFGTGQIWRDVWYLWTSVLDGPVTIETCGLTTADTKIAVYSPAAPCVPSSEFVVACNDDFCATQTSVTFLAKAGQEYRIRIGRFGSSEPAASGSGQIEISAPGGFDICASDGGPCQDANLADGAWNSSLGYRAADDFEFDASGAITGVCWAGSYADPEPDTDAFRVTYWTDSGGYPSTPIATFEQGQNMVVHRAWTGAYDIVNNPHFAYSTVHAPVMVNAGERYWVEVRNVFGGVWFWQASQTGNGSLQDFTPGDAWANSDSTPDFTMCVGFESSCANDTNGDGYVNFADLNNVVSSFNQPCP